MTTQELISNMKSRFDRCIGIVERKNHDYADGNHSNDCFRNFRLAPYVGVPEARGILVRITDKISRISNLLDNDPSVQDEKIEDSIDDAINYLVIMAELVKEKR